MHTVCGVEVVGWEIEDVVTRVSTPTQMGILAALASVLTDQAGQLASDCLPPWTRILSMRYPLQILPLLSKRNHQQIRRLNAVRKSTYKMCDVLK